MSGIICKEIGSFEAMGALRPQWQTLLNEAAEPTVFDTWEWQYLCARHLIDEQDLTLLAVYDGQRMIALLPLCRIKVREAGPVTVPALAPLGGAVTDYNSFLVDSAHRHDAVTILMHYLINRRLPLKFENVLPGSPLDSLAGDLTRNGYRGRVYETKLALVSRLEGGYDIFNKSLTRKLRRNIRQNQNYMDRVGGYSYHVENADNNLLRTLIDLHSSRWGYKGEGGALALDNVRRLHAELHALDGRPFDIRYYTIRHNDDIVAILYGFLYRNRFYAYLSGLDMAHNRISPGNMVFNYCIRKLCKDNVAVFDMLRGDMFYKRSWATASYDMKDILYFPPSFGGRCLYGTMALTQAVKKVIPAPAKKRLRSLLGRQHSGGRP